MTAGVRLQGRAQPPGGAIFRVSVLTGLAAVGRHLLGDQMRLLAPALTLVAVVGVRHFAGADGVRYELLLLIPVLWLALQGTFAELVVAVLGLTLGMALLNGTGQSAVAGWSDQALFAGVAGTVGLTVHRLMARVRRQARDVSAIARVVRDVASATDAAAARAAVCRAATEICEAELALMLEPDGEGRLVVSAAEGSDVAVGTMVPMDGLDAAVRDGLWQGENRYLPDEGGPLCCAAIGAGSALLAPVRRGGEPAGALVVGWRRRARRITPRMAEAIDMFALEAARSIERADLMSQVHAHAADLEAVTEISRRLPRAGNAQSARDAVCQAVLDVCGGMLAVLMEPDGAGHLVSTAVAGAEVSPMRVALDDVRSATVSVFQSLEPFFVADLGAHASVSPRLVDATGAVSGLWQPVVGDGAPVGVLVVAWDARLRQLSDRAAAVVGLFAAEAAVAIERADLMARLEGLNRMLAVQLEALRVSDQLKSDFVSSVSHELRTPLASILGYLDVVIEGEVGELSRDQFEFLRIVEENARRLLSLIDGLLTLSGIESGRMLLRPEPVDIRSLIARLAGDQEQMAYGKQQSLLLDLPSDPLVVELDPERIGQVVTNVVANAIKFTPAGGEVAVSLRRDGARARITVTDTGIGIPAEDTDRLFERFFRARNAVDGAIPGTGLGLAICRGIVDAHGGDIAVESVPDAGTKITVCLPMTMTTT